VAKIRSDKLAIILASLALAGVLSTSIATVVAADAPPKLEKSCIQIYEDYLAAIEKGPVQREAILPGTNGASILDSDPQAEYCGLKPEDFPPP
jgi:hypothetical protein